MSADTAKMASKVPLSCLLPLVCALLAAALPADAEMYKWTDDKGRVRFSDTPPADGRAEKLEVRDVPRIDQKTAESAYPKYAGNLPSKLLHVNPPKLWVENGAPGMAVVGTERSGPNCGRVVPQRMNNTGWIPLTSEAIRQISANMGDGGYEVLDIDRREAPHYRLLPLVTDLHVDACTAGRAMIGRASARLEVRWELSEFAGGRVLHSVTTTGSWGGRNASFGQAISNALFDASVMLFKDGSFTDYLRPGIAEVLTPARSQNVYDGVDVPPLPFDFGPAPGLSFKSVQESVVTIRANGGHGSGFVVAAGGWILTNWHVVKNASEAVVVFDRREVPATVIRANPKRDVALLKTDVPIDAKALALAPEQVGVGESVYVVGTPFDESLSQTVTRGIISALRMRKEQPFLQTDAALNPGNSGGPALNEAGQVVGIAVAGHFSTAGGALNINYLIPITDALERMALRSSLDSAPASLAP